MIFNKQLKMWKQELTDQMLFSKTEKWLPMQQLGTGFKIEKSNKPLLIFASISGEIKGVTGLGLQFDDNLIKQAASLYQGNNFGSLFAFAILKDV